MAGGWSGFCRMKVDRHRLTVREWGCPDFLRARMGAITNCHTRLVSNRASGKATKFARRSREEYAAETSCRFLIARSYSFASTGAARSRLLHACPTSSWALLISGLAVLISLTLEMKRKRQMQTPTTLKTIQIFFKVHLLLGHCLISPQHHAEISI